MARTFLRTLLTVQHLTGYEAFERRFRKTAKEVGDAEGNPAMGKLTVSVRQFERWSAGTVKSQPRPDTCRVLEAMFGYPVHVLLAPPDQVGRARGTDTSSGEARAPSGRPGFGDDLAAEIAHESQEFGDWVAMSEVADETISQYQAQVRRLARDFEYASPLPLLLETRRLRDLVASRLRGHVRPDQARDLYLLGAEVCGLLAWMTGDLGDYRAADKHAWAAWACAEQAGHDGARAWVRATQAKLAYWDGRYSESANLAAAGFEYAAGDTARVFLALFRARALARNGQHVEGRRALAEAGAAREHVTTPDQLGGVWGLTSGRFHGLAASTWLLLGEPGRVLADAAEAIATSQSAPPAERHLYSEVLAHADSACAHLQSQDLDGAAVALRPVLDLPTQSRIDPVRQQVARFKQQLAVHEVDTGPVAVALRDEIETWDRTAIPPQITSP